MTVSFTCHRNNFLKDPFKAKMRIWKLLGRENHHIFLCKTLALSQFLPALFTHLLICVCWMVVFIMSTFVAFILISVHVIPIVPWNLVLALDLAVYSKVFNAFYQSFDHGMSILGFFVLIYLNVEFCYLQFFQKCSWVCILCYFICERVCYSFSYTCNVHRSHFLSLRTLMIFLLTFF